MKLVLTQSGQEDFFSQLQREKKIQKMIYGLHSEQMTKLSKKSALSKLVFISKWMRKKQSTLFNFIHNFFVYRMIL